MSKRLAIPAIFVCLGVPAAFADVTEVQQAVELPIRITSRFDITLHARIRSQPGGLGFLQDRGGVITDFWLNGRTALVAGYYYEHQKSARDWRAGGHRPWAGIQGTLWAPSKFVFEGRSVVERYTNIGFNPSFTRYRNRLRISWNRRVVSPYGGVELFVDAHGWRSTRYAAGFRWHLSRDVNVDLGYFVEPRRPNTGEMRHMWTTTVRLREIRRR